MSLLKKAKTVDTKDCGVWDDFTNNFESFVPDEKWKSLVRDKKDLLDKLLELIEKNYEKYNGYFHILPSKNLVMNALTQTPFDSVKVVILGQDPYQTLAFPIGMSFAVRKGVEVPKSLVNIYKELNLDKDVEFEIPSHGDLTR